MGSSRFTGLSGRLLREGISPARVRRLVAELEAHFQDLLAELQAGGLSREESEREASRRVGSEDLLVASITARPELRTWSRRWPWLAFLVLPLLSLPVQFVLSMLAAVGIVHFGEQVLGLSAMHPGAVPRICAALQGYALWVAPMLAVGVTSWLAVRQRVPVRWPLIGSALIAYVGALTNAGFEWNPAVAKGMLTAGIGFPGRGAETVLRLGLTLLVMLGAFLWGRRSLAPAEHSD